MNEKVLRDEKNLLKGVKNKITSIFILQMVLLLLSIFVLAKLNSTTLANNDQFRIICNSAVFGFIGCLIYFSRKSYVYLITGKFQKMILDGQDASINDIDSIKCAIRGYYLYLIFRPFVGLIIGPILYMFTITGLITFIKKTVNNTTELAQSGRYFIYIISFIGGHASSDILDRFSKLAKSIVAKETE